MNPFVLAGAVTLIGVLLAYVVITRRDIAQRPPIKGQAKAAVARGERPKTKPPGQT